MEVVTTTSVALVSTSFLLLLVRHLLLLAWHLFLKTLWNPFKHLEIAKDFFVPRLRLEPETASLSNLTKPRSDPQNVGPQIYRTESLDSLGETFCKPGGILHQTTVENPGHH